MSRDRELLNRYVHGSIDFLNIDIETGEQEVLGAWDWQKCRPKVICAEIHSLGINEMLGGEVAQILNRAGYSAMSRGWQSSLFVDNVELDRLMRGIEASDAAE